MIDVPPLTFSREERAAWRIVAAKLAAVHVITKIDLLYLENFVGAWADYKTRLRAAKKAPPHQRRAWIRLIDSGRRIARKYAAGFFLIPQGRVGLGPVDSASGEDVELAKIFAPGVPIRRLYREREK